MSDDAFKKQFGAVDFAVFTVTLLLSILIGVFFAYKDRRKFTTSNYYFADGKMTARTIGISMAVTYRSAISLIGIPTEVYIVGNSYLVYPISFAVIAFVCCVYLIPIYKRTDLKTLYQYLELRFNKATRLICVPIVILSTLIYIGTTVYLPAMAINAVTPISATWSLVLTTTICTFYTTVGGMKAVIWTDVLQCGIMLIGIISLFVRALTLIGGFDNLFAAIERGERNTIQSGDYDVTSRSSPLSVFAGTVGGLLYNIGFSQQIVQRYQSCRSVRQAQYALLIYLIPSVLIILFTVAIGCVMFAFFEGCDPVKSGKLEKLDQSVPYMALEVFSELPGMTGLFVAAIFAASLSTVSSGLNSLSVLFVEDFVVLKWPKMTERVKLIVGKASVAVIGLLLFFISFMVYAFKSNAIKLIYSLLGLLDGPLMGLFILGMFFPWTNSAGAIVGTLSSVVLVSWIFLGTTFLKPAIDGLHVPPNGIDACPTNGSSETISTLNWVNFTSSTVDTSPATVVNSTLSTLSEDGGYTIDQYIYSLNFHYYTLTGTFLTIIIGLLVSFATGYNKPSKMDPKLFIPLVESKIFPASVRKFFRFGVAEIEKRSDFMLEQCNVEEEN